MVSLIVPMVRMNTPVQLPLQVSQLMEHTPDKSDVIKTDLFGSIEYIYIYMYIYNACQLYSVECVSKIKCILSFIFVQYMGLSVFR